MTHPTTGAAPTIFTFQNGKPHPVRIYTDAAGEPLFHAGDLCELLEYVNPRQALAQHVEKDDVTKRDVIDRLGRKQQANFVREPGMWSLLLGSHAPNAKKVKRWITAEVLPAIRKTGGYSLPAPASEYSDPAHEQLDNADLGNLTRMIWLICRDMAGERAWVQGVWSRLRQATGCPAPNRFQVRHLPIIAAEMRRIWAISEALQRAQREATRVMIKRVLRGGEPEGPVLAELEHLYSTAHAQRDEELEHRLERWHDHELMAIPQRKRDIYHGGYLKQYSESMTQQ